MVFAKAITGRCNMRRTLVAAVSLLFLVGLAACTESDVTGTGIGSLSVYLTDAPIDLDDVTAVNVTVAAMSVFPHCDDPNTDCPGRSLDLVPPDEGDGVIVNLLDYRDGVVILMVSEQIPEGL
jgi:hypothetical protein